MSLQTSSHPKARSLIVFLLSVISLGSLLTQWYSGRGPRPPTPCPCRGWGQCTRSHSQFQQRLPKSRWQFFPGSNVKNKGYRSQNKFIFKGCRKNKIESGKKGLVSHEIFGLNQLKIEIFWANFIWNFTLEVKMSGSYWIMVQQQIS